MFTGWVFFNNLFRVSSRAERETDFFTTRWAPCSKASCSCPGNSPVMSATIRADGSLSRREEIDFKSSQLEVPTESRTRSGRSLEAVRIVWLFHTDPKTVNPSADKVLVRAARISGWLSTIKMETGSVNMCQILSALSVYYIHEVLNSCVNFV